MHELQGRIKAYQQIQDRIVQIKENTLKTTDGETKFKEQFFLLAF